MKSKETTTETKPKRVRKVKEIKLPEATTLPPLLSRNRQILLDLVTTSKEEEITVLMERLQVITGWTIKHLNDNNHFFPEELEMPGNVKMYKDIYYEGLVQINTFISPNGFNKAIVPDEL